MSSRNAALQLYRTFFSLTKDCPDKSLKLYIRRRAREDFRATMQMNESEASK